MNAQISPDAARNGFTALPQAEKDWFLIRVRQLTHREVANERPGMTGMALI
jgi:hypothetical protein